MATAVEWTVRRVVSGPMRYAPSGRVAGVHSRGPAMRALGRGMPAGRVGERRRALAGGWRPNGSGAVFPGIPFHSAPVRKIG